MGQNQPKYSYEDETRDKLNQYDQRHNHQRRLAEIRSYPGGIGQYMKDLAEYQKLNEPKYTDEDKKIWLKAYNKERKALKISQNIFEDYVYNRCSKKEMTEAYEYWLETSKQLAEVQRKHGIHK